MPGTFLSCGVSAMLHALITYSQKRKQLRTCSPFLIRTMSTNFKAPLCYIFLP